jgi:serine/threonine-protein kinase
LVATLEELGLSTAAQVRRIRGRVRRLSRELPAYDQVWIDALVQARHLTPFQAEVLAEGDPAQLAVGEYVLCERLGGSDLGETFRARRRKSRGSVALKVLHASPDERDEVRARLERHLEAMRNRLLASKQRHANEASRSGVAVPFALDVEDGRLFLVEPFVVGPSPVDLLVHRGRIRPEAVVEIARQLLATILRGSENGLCHGDLRPSNLRLTKQGVVVVTDWGLRASMPGRVLVPERGLPPERFDYQAQERYAPGHQNQVSGDLYALGCVLYHLLAGRPPFPGDALAKAMAHQSRRVPDVRELVPDIPPALADTIHTLTQRDPVRRAPDGLPPLVERLGRPSRRGRRALARYLGGRGWRAVGRRPKPAPSRARTLSVAGLAIAAVASAVWVGAGKQRVNTWVEDGVAVARSLLAKATRLDAPPRTPPTASIGNPNERGFDPAPQSTEVTSSPAATPAAPQGPASNAAVAEPGRRTLLIPREGLRVSQPKRVFQDLDLRFAQPATPKDHAQATGAGVVAVTTSEARFVRCRFFGVAVHWTVAAGGESDPQRAANGDGDQAPRTLIFENCIFEGATAAVVCEAGASVSLRFENCLALGPGAMVRVASFPSQGSEIAIAVEASTLRGGEGAIRLAGGGTGSQHGNLRIRANDSVFAAATALLLFEPEADEKLLGRVTWQGTGSLIPEEMMVAARIDAGGKAVLLDGTAMLMEGIVPTALEFRATTASAQEPARSEVRDAGGAPSLSGRVPGIVAARLPATKKQPS